jgi:FkbM family methyltransferase
LLDNESCFCRMNARPSLLRRVERRVRPWLRAPLAPLFNRFRKGVRKAVDSSASADTIRDIDRRLGPVETALEAIGRVETETQRLLAVLTSFEQQFAVRFERLQLGVDAVRRDHQEVEAAIRQELEAVRATTLAVATDGQQAHANALAVAGVALQRADLLLQRAAIPLGADVMVRTPLGFLLAPAEDERLVAAMYESGGRLEPGTVGVISALLSEGDWAVDVGAHIGTTVLPAARRVGPTGRVLAVEPASRVGNLLQRSILMNGLEDRISLHACAAGEAAGRAELNLGPMTGHSSLLPLPEADRAESVEVWPLDDLVEPGQAIRLVKLDAEGFELRVWRGMRRIIADNPALTVLVEFGPTHLNRAGVSVENWLAEMLAPNFAAYEVDESDGCLRPLRAAAELRAVFSVNLLLLRQPPGAFPALRFT